MYISYLGEIFVFDFGISVAYDEDDQIVRLTRGPGSFMTQTVRLQLLAVVYAIGQLLAVVPASAAQDPQVDMEDWQRAELQTLVDVVAAAVRGQGVFTEKPFRMTTDFLKGLEGKTYVPFTLSVDPSLLTESSLAMYVFVTPHRETPPPSGDGTIEVPDPVFEDGHFVEFSGQAEGETIEVSRSFSAEGGAYDVYLAIRDSLGATAEEEARLQSTVLLLKEELEIPDFWNERLQTSSLIVAELVEPLDQPLSADQQVANPYTLGTTRIVPKTNREFLSAEELALIMLVYNPQLTSDQMPDLTVDYSFHIENEAGEEFFNKTNPQQFNAQTLPPGFDLAGGHQIVAGQSVPLGGFQTGRYRLEIIVTDNLSGQSVVSDLTFNVTE